MGKVSRKDLQEMPLGELIEKLQDDPEYIAAKLYSKFADVMYDRMKELKLKRIGLAKKLKKSPSYISQILNREINPTLFTMEEFLDAVELTMKISYEVSKTVYASKEIDKYEDLSRLGSIDQNVSKIRDNIIPFSYKPGEKPGGLWQMEMKKSPSDISNKISDVA